MKAKLPSSAFVKFSLFAGSLYLALYIIYQLIIKKYTYYDQKFIGTIIQNADFILKLLNYSTFKVLQDRDVQVLGIDGSNGLWIGSNCNAINLFVLFSVFIIAYPGQQKPKLWFIPVGIIAIHVLNLVRVIALVLIAYHSPQSLNFNHTYTFTFIIYSFIFLLWIVWVNKFSSKKTNALSEN
jgi:exosortase family protein XrtF